MKKYLFLLLSIIIIEIYSNSNNTNDTVKLEDKDNTNNTNIITEQNNNQSDQDQQNHNNNTQEINNNIEQLNNDTQEINNDTQEINNDTQQNNNNNIQEINNNTQEINDNTQQNQNNGTQQIDNNNKTQQKPSENQLEKNNNNEKEKKNDDKDANEKKEIPADVPKKDVKGRGLDPTKKKGGEKKKEDKPFNLTESLINFFNKTLGDLGKKDKEAQQRTKEEIEEMRRRKEEENQRRAQQEREMKRRREAYEARQSEMIRIENKRKEEKKKKEKEEREKFDKIISNTTFEEHIQISLDRGETETLYLDLESFTKIKMAVILTDEEEKISFVISGPNSRGRTSVLFRLDNRNYLYHEYESLRKGEYSIDITNKGSKENELIFLFNEHVNKDKKKDILNTEKIDKISLLLNNIDNNVNQLRNKKKIEIRQVNSHNDKVDNNNKSIVIYSIIEIFTMIIIFVAQSYYISSFVAKI